MKNCSFFKFEKDYLAELSENDNACPIMCHKEYEHRILEIFKGKTLINKNEFKNVEIITFGHEYDKELSKALAKRLNIPSVDINDLNELCINKYYIIIALIDNSQKENLINDFIRLHAHKKVTLVVSKEKQTLSVLIGKLLTKPDVSHSNDLYINMIDPKVPTGIIGDIQFINRKNNPFEYLTTTTDYFDSLSFIAHGNGQLIYFGKNRLLGGDLLKESETDTSISSVVNNFKLNHMFINSCYSITFGEIERCTYENLVLSNLSTMIMYRGLKDNSFADCIWYLILKKFNYQLSDICKIINENLTSRTTDAPHYILIGNPFLRPNIVGSENLFIEYAIDLNEMVLFTKENIGSHFGKVNIKGIKDVSNLTFINEKRINWVIDYKNEVMLFYCEKILLPSELKIDYKTNIIQLGKREPFSNILLLKPNWSKDIRNSVAEWTNQFDGLTDLLGEEILYSDVSFKIKKRVSAIQKLKAKIFEKIMIELTSSQVALSPLSEVYIHKFRTDELKKENNQNCKVCEGKIYKKRLVNNIDNSVSREITICMNCGQLSDLANNVNLIVSNLTINDSENKLIIEITSTERNILLAANILGGSFEENLMHIDSHHFGKFSFTIQIDEWKNFNALRVYVIKNDELSILYNPLQLDNLKNDSLNKNNIQGVAY